MLKQSYQDALDRWKKNITASDNRLFFIEDTSVAIESLSTAEREIPGLDVKYWMAETNFAALDKQLKELGNNRHASVRSDLVLHLSKDLRELAQNKPYLCFTSSVSGSIVNKELNIETNPLYPWLDNKSFNKWFVPNGCKKPISLLPITQADQYDFRANAFKEMLAFLEQNKKITRRSEPEKQQNLDVEEPLIIICGPSCAGKTTLAEYLAGKFGYYHIEASDFMYLSYYQRHGVTSTVKIGDFAEQALKDQPEIVARQILQNIQENKANLVVVTGFRSPLEIEWFQNYYTGEHPILVCFVTADADIRFMRSVSRNRDETASNRDTFDSADKQQFAMGLGEIENRFDSSTIKNNESLESFFSFFEEKYLKNKQLSPSKHLATSELEKLILLALLKEWSGRNYFTTTEIAHLINDSLSEKPKSKNNISRYLNQRLYPYFDIKLIDGKRKYRLSNTGYGKASLLNL
ncbi:MAG: hypothetical protein CTY24_12315 [Methylobacter sp.]|nr:MAG: hypothetical protein CTY24_12315 [Methylobacter sp.]